MPENRINNDDKKRVMLLSKQLRELKVQANKRNLNKTNNTYTFSYDDRKQLSQKLLQIVRTLEVEERKLRKIHGGANKTNAIEKTGRIAQRAFSAAYTALVIASMIQGLAPQFMLAGSVAQGVFTAGSSGLARVRKALTFTKALKQAAGS
jgi:hypothetical protein